MDKIRILVAEDIEATISLYKKAITEQYFEKQFAKDGRQALMVYQEWKPDILLLDIKMPEITGIDLLQIIRDKLGDRHTTIIMSTSESTMDDVKKCAAFGIEGYILKPFKVKKLEEQILTGFAKKRPDLANVILELKKSLEETPLVEALPQEEQSSQKEPVKQEEQPE